MGGSGWQRCPVEEDDWCLGDSWRLVGRRFTMRLAGRAGGRDGEARGRLGRHRATLWWPATVSKPTGSGERSRGEGDYEEAKWERRTLLLGAGAGIRPLTHVGRRRSAVTGISALSVVSTIIAWWPTLWRAGARSGTGCPGWNPFWAAACGLGPVKRFPSIQNYLKFRNSNLVPSQGPKLFKLCMRLYLNILSNFFNWVDFKFSLDHML
jgi:hypothetical protein